MVEVGGVFNRKLMQFGVQTTPTSPVLHRGSMPPSGPTKYRRRPLRPLLVKADWRCQVWRVGKQCSERDFTEAHSAKTPHIHTPPLTGKSSRIKPCSIRSLGATYRTFFFSQLDKEGGGGSVLECTALILPETSPR